jgi:SNF2 family DNA or RNA helicase
MTIPLNVFTLKSWADLTAEQQLRLREEYGRYLDTLPPTCDLGTKLERFRRWLAERGVRFDDAG